MLLRFPEPYSFELSTERFRTFGSDLANLWYEDGLHRVVGGREVRIVAAAGGVDVEPLDDETRPVIEKLLGAEFELEPFRAWATGRPVIGELSTRLAGFRPPIAPDAFESLVTSITAQQVSLIAAAAIRGRFIQRFGERAEHAYAFPRRERVAQAEEAELVAVGFSRRKAEYVVGLARHELDLDSLAVLDDDEVRARLTAIRGIGLWTAEWFLARHLARPRAWPAGDLVLRKAAALFYGLDVHELGRTLDPFQNLSAHYLLTGMRVPWNIRRATEADESTLRKLWEEFELEIPEADGVGPAPAWEAEWADLRTTIASGAVYLAEDDDGPAGTAQASVGPGPLRSHLQLVYVRPRARREGVAKALVRACVVDLRAKGVVRISLDVLWTNTTAREVWTRLGFEEVALVMATPTEALERRLAKAPGGPSRAVIHVQSDDRVSVERALAQFVPRLESPDVTAEANGWMRITEPLTDADRDARGRLAKELSERLGAVVVALAIESGAVVRFRLYERGMMVDEYLSVPTFYGALPKGDELALAANPTLVARLTGANRDEVRRVARTALSPADLPPADELYSQIARTMGLEP